MSSQLNTIEGAVGRNVLQKEELTANDFQ